MWASTGTAQLLRVDAAPHSLSTSILHCTHLVTSTMGNPALLTCDIVKRSVAPPTVETVNYTELVMHKESDRAQVLCISLKI